MLADSELAAGPLAELFTVGTPIIPEVTQPGKELVFVVEIDLIQPAVVAAAPPESPIVGSVAATEAADVFAATGSTAVTITGTLAATDAPDVFAATGDVIVDGALAATEDADTFAASGTVGVAQIIHTIKPAGGGDYADLAAWEAAQQRDLVAADEIAVAECYAGTDANQCGFGGWTSDATRYVHIRAAPGVEPGGLPSGGYLMSATTAGNMLTLANTFIRVTGIRVANTGSGAGIACNAGSATCWIERCVIGPCGSNGINWGSVSANLKAYNNIIFDCTTTGIRCNTSGTHHLYNNTICDCGIGINQTAGTVRPKNNIVQGGTTNYSGTMTASATNISSDATSPQAGLRNINLTFVNEAGNNFHLAAGDTQAIGAGTDLSADTDIPFSNDVDAATRTAPWDIGADQR